MKTFAWVAVVMAAFAANSVLTRAGIVAGLDPVVFGLVRLWAGAVVLVALARGRVPWRGSGRIGGVLGLLVYVAGFSLAYTGLDSGLGALILFGCVQVTMVGGAMLAGERPGVLRWLGTAVAFCGLIWLLWPGAGPAVSLWQGGAMALAGAGWGVYSLVGRGAGDPLAATAANFAVAAPLMLLAMPLAGSGWSDFGFAMAVVSGAVTSGLGYALWYAVLPRLDGAVAAVAQLTVPVIAMAGGVVFLGEALTGRFVLAACVVLGGVALSVLGPRYLRIGSSGS
ncbi:DMT family transporter [Sagittula salina]|uniref:DMT family transporter n=1 Tax=Sagittula salina TaxID=2820268 RepID=A0A940RZU9_9RHOB|nr:DMT family transporter [Sagittula salina]MBP0482358.1 DMT family transporter [Sagittula salina]